MESRPTQAVLPLVGLAADKVIRDRYNSSVAQFFFRIDCGKRPGFPRTDCRQSSAPAPLGQSRPPISRCVAQQETTGRFDDREVFVTLQ
ncbi:MAG: hypothetical protein ACQESR_22550 [Planctomycetota bacterium]